jgi:signal peptidase I
MSDYWNPEEPEKTDEPEAAEEQPAAPAEAPAPEWPVYVSPTEPPLTATEGEPRGDLLTPEAAERVARRRHTRDPLAKLFPGLPRGARVTLDWILTIAGAVLIVFALKQWVVNPYRIPSSSMEPTLHCAKPGQGCLGNSSDRVLACRICFDFTNPSRGDVVVFNTPRAAARQCGEGGTFVKRVIGLPGETVKEDEKGNIWIRGPDKPEFVKLKEPYVSKRARLLDSEHFGHTWSVPNGQYFMMGDNRSESCDSRSWGAVPRGDLIGTVFFVYWPPDRIGFLGAALALLALPFAVGRRPTFS